MKTNHFKIIPPGVLLIAVFYIFGAFVLLVSIFTNPFGASQVIARAHGLPAIMGVEVLVAVAALALVIAYGLISLSRWGFFLAISYLIFLAGISLLMGGLNFLWTGQAELRITFGNFLWSLLAGIYLLIMRSRFLSPQSPGAMDTSHTASASQGWTGIDDFLAEFSTIQMLPVIPSLLLVPEFTALMVGIHSYATEDKKIWSLLGSLVFWCPVFIAATLSPAGLFHQIARKGES